jgi:hypothetical protein
MNRAFNSSPPSSTVSKHTFFSEICNYLIVCQAQPKLQVKLSLNAELALISINAATITHSPTHPNGKVYFSAFLSK